MASTAIKSTYALDVRTMQNLERLAARWRVSKSEVLRRVVNAAAVEEHTVPLTPIEAFHKLKENINLTDEQLQDWARDVKKERLASSRRFRWPRK